jgi:hypothetical protein
VRLPEGRLALTVETAAYRLISETVTDAHGRPVTLTAFTDDGLLSLSSSLGLGGDVRPGW